MLRALLHAVLFRVRLVPPQQVAALHAQRFSGVVFRVVVVYLAAADALAVAEELFIRADIETLNCAGLLL